jgi:chromosome segregation ATPase
MVQKTNNVIISILLFACFILYAIIELRPGQTKQLHDSSTRLKELKAANDSLKKSNAELDRRFELLQEKADRLQQLVISANDSIIRLKQKQHEKVSAIDQFHTNELLDFFANYKTDGSVNR